MCGSNIYPSEEYRLEVIANNGQVYNWKQCDCCLDIVEKMSDEGWYPDGITHQMFNEFVSDNNIEFKRR